MAVESADDLASFFAADEFALTASYTPPGGGAAAPCTILVDKRDPDAQSGEGRPQAGIAMIKVRKSEIAGPARNGAFFVAAQDGHPLAATYVVMDRPIADDSAETIWKMWVR
jgi:hypothetical protein